MNILMISSGSEFYGGERIMLLLADFILKKSDKVIFLLPEKGKFSAILKNKKIRFYINGPKNSFDISSLLTIKKIIKKENIEIIHSHGFNANIFSRLAGFLFNKKVISTIHVIQEFDSGLSLFKRNWYKYIDIFTSRIFKKNNILTAVSPAVKDSLKYLGRKIVLIPNGVEKPSNEYDFPEKIKKIGFIGRIVNIKGVEELLIGFTKLIKEYKHFDLRLIIAGEDITPEKRWENKYKLIIKENNISKYVELIGYVKDVEKFYDQVDAVVVPSYREPFGLVVLESLIRKKLILTTNNSGPEYILKDLYPKDLMVTARSSESVYKGLKRLVGLNRNEIENIFNESLCKRIAFFDMDNMLKKYYRIYMGEKYEK